VAPDIKRTKKENNTMKQFRNVLVVSVMTLSIAFAGGLGFSINSNWSDLEGNAAAGTGYSVMFDFNDQTSLGFDSVYGMLATFDVVLGAQLRLGFSADAGNTIGLGYDFWSGGDAIKTALGVSVNYTKTAAADETSISLGVSWGF